MKKNIKYIVPALIILFLFFLFTNKKSTIFLKGNNQSTVQLVEPIEFKSLSKNKDSFLLDVHIPEQTHIPGTDAFIPYNEIESNSDKLPQDKNTPILVYCRSGSMSKEASDTLAKLGYTKIYDLKGGINAYKDQVSDVVILPQTKDLGEVVYGDIVKTEYELFNFTKNTLKITSISGSCECTTPKMEKMDVAPFSSEKIVVSFNPAVHKDDSDLGQLSRTIYVRTDNPNFPQVTAGFTANVIKK